MKVLTGLLVVSIVVGGCQYTIDTPLPDAPSLTPTAVCINARGAYGQPVPLVFSTSSQLSAVQMRGHRTTRLSTSGGVGDAFVKGNQGMGLVRFGGLTDEHIVFEGGSSYLVKNDSLPFDTVTLSGGVWPDSLLHLSNTIVTVLGNIRVEAGKQLHIQEGCAVRLGGEVNLLVQGSLKIAGSAAAPVIFRSIDWQKPWGGVVITNATTPCQFAHTFFVNGGGVQDGLYQVGHSHSQACLHAVSSTVLIDNCYFLYNPGKGVTALSSTITITNSLIAFCDMGGEFGSSQLSVDSSLICFLPNHYDEVLDDDNDGFYLSGSAGAVHDSLYCRITNTTFYLGDDDAIDHNGAFLLIDNCWIEGFAHEGLAASNTNQVRIQDSYVVACEQGIEAGYWNPSVVVDHCLIEQCTNGLRFGDWYDWGCDGRLSVTNTISHKNRRAVYNLDLKTGGAKPTAISISHSILDSDDTSYGRTNHYAPAPLNYQLLLASTMVGSDGKSIGLCSPR
jgi:hypothetical protein